MLEQDAAEVSCAAGARSAAGVSVAAGAREPGASATGVHELVGHSLICWNLFRNCPDASWEPC